MPNPLQPVDVVQHQLDAYNRRDLEAFLAVFADEAVVQDLGAATPSLTGRAQLRQRYQELFERSPALYSRLVARTAFGHVVVDLEHISGRMGATAPVEILAIYEVRDSLIVRVHFVRQAG